MGLYLESGFINIRHCMRSGCPFVIIVGGRGTGKTYGALQAAIEDQTPFILMRRTQAQADLIGKTEFSPIQPVVNDMGRTQSCKSLSKYTSAIYLDPDAEEPKLAGWTAALSTFSNLRGFDASSVQLLIYDEFIPESHERPIKNEGDAFLNCYETINRNRELQGRPPVQAMLLSNANRMDSPILDALGLIPILERMNKTGQETYIPLKEKTILGKELFNAFRKLDILQELIEDEDITEIMINGTEHIFIEKEGKISQLPKRFVSKNKLEDVIQQMVASANRMVNEASPIVDARLEDGSRVNVVLYPVALNGPIVTIRKFPKEVITMEELIRLESISREIAEFLEKLVISRYNIFVSGGTGSG